MLPKRYYTLPLTIDNKNVMGISEIQYKPIEWELINQVRDTFNYDEKRTGTSKAIDLDSDKHYGPITNHEFLSDIKTDASAQVISKAKIAEHAFHYPGFTAEILGSVLLEPGQYINVTLPQYHINGNYEIQAITNKIDFVQGLYLSTLEFNRTTGKFYNMIKRFNKLNMDMKWVRNTGVYDTSGSLAAGYDTSLGAFSN
jgi:hypothetical protein